MESAHLLSVSFLSPMMDARKEQVHALISCSFMECVLMSA